MKKNPQTNWLLPASLGMELGWRLAWAVMTMTPITHRLFPVAEAVLVFVAATGITRFVSGWGWRRWAVFAVQGVGCGCACLLLIHSHYRQFPFFSAAWMSSVFASQKTPLEWLVLGLTIFWASVFWFGGMAQSQRSADYLKICHRFDTGVGMLLGLLLIKIILVHDRVLAWDPMMVWLIALFSLSGLMAIGLARQDGHISRTFMTGYRIQGVLISVVIIMLMLSVILSAVLWPCLNTVAESGFVLFKAGAQALGPVVVAVFSVVFRKVRALPTTAMSSNDAEWIPGAPDRWSANLLEIVFWGFGGLTAIIAVIALGVGLWRFFQWLFSKISEDNETAHRSGRLLDWLLRLNVFLSLCWEWIAHYIRNYNTMAHIYRALINWGKHCGVPCRQTETPLEFSRRLILLLPAAQPEIALISDLFQSEIYAEKKLNARQFTQARGALRRLRSPALWISRIKLWFLEK